ncbi:coiled-coil domain-containing protein 63-like [Homarus americanus]|nr:coiled-coil domain-containing protein 63-like [Homarus americanus]
MSKREDKKEAGEDVELEGAETLLARLRRQYRMMERNRRQYHDEATVLLGRQRKILRDLQKEKGELEGLLSAMATSQNETRDNKTVTTLASTLDRQAKYNELIDQEKDKIKDLDTSIAAAEKRLRESRRRVPSARQLESRRMVAINANKALQNRIQQATVRLNAVLADNRVLRSTLENLLKERDKFMLQAQRLEKQLAATVKRKSDIMDQVTKAYSERDEAQTKMRALKERAERDSQQYTHELKKLQRALDHQNHLRAFVATISAGEDEDASHQRLEGEGGEPRGPEQTLATYRASVAHLSEMSGEGSVDTLVSNYLQAENDNYTLFTYISDLNNEVTSLTAEVRRIRQQIEETRGKGADKERNSQRTVSQLQTEVRETEEALEILEGDLRRAEDTLTEMKTATQELFDLLQCDAQPIIAIVGGGEITSASVSVYLSVVEQRVHELLQLRQFLLTEDLSPGAAAALGEDAAARDDVSEGRSSSASSAKVVVPLGKPQLTHTAHTNDEESANGGPLTHGDLLANMRRFIPDTGDH